MSELTTVFATVDFSTVAAAVGAAMILVVGIAAAFKGGDLGKRAVKKA